MAGCLLKGLAIGRSFSLFLFGYLSNPLSNPDSECPGFQSHRPPHAAAAISLPYLQVPKLAAAAARRWRCTRTPLYTLSQILLLHTLPIPPIQIPGISNIPAILRCRCCPQEAEVFQKVPQLAQLIKHARRSLLHTVRLSQTLDQTVL